jgi:AbrB family looped-hinge helix DNA binding protein
MSTATLSSKFQLSVPKAVREAMHLQPGQQFEMIPIGSVIQLVPKTTIKELRGIALGANSSKYRDRKDRA